MFNDIFGARPSVVQKTPPLSLDILACRKMLERLMLSYQRSALKMSTVSISAFETLPLSLLMIEFAASLTGQLTGKCHHMMHRRV